MLSPEAIDDAGAAAGDKSVGAQQTEAGGPDPCGGAARRVTGVRGVRGHDCGHPCPCPARRPDRVRARIPATVAQHGQTRRTRSAAPPDEGNVWGRAVWEAVQPRAAEGETAHGLVAPRRTGPASEPHPATPAYGRRGEAAGRGRLSLQCAGDDAKAGNDARGGGFAFPGAQYRQGVQCRHDEGRAVASRVVGRCAAPVLRQREGRATVLGHPE